ncbi:splicing factor 3A subunit 3 family protein [Onchocerca flexuosa]|uniref:Splicing factor 3A subunit 3 family protein n=1 Tax=Onchocerca flexuosa TaxID=387005 RepID=A0A238BN43_9BILA|nr:splicing factor 3A subunit 3 family protein [Onchocerca flexuosa]
MIAIPLSLEFQKMNEAIENIELAEKDMIEFTDEEGYGRFLDLHILYDKYINIKGVKRMDYLTFLSNFDCFADIPVSSKKTGSYREYLNALKEYFVTFLARTRPLLSMNEEFEKVDAEFDKKWEEGTIPGWSRDQHSALAHSGAYLDLSSFETATDLEALGLDRLKSALVALGLKCGGTLKERAERLFATKGHKLSEIEKTALAKRHDTDQKEQFKLRQTARLEAYIQRLSALLGDEREATKENVERKQARSIGENMEEEEDINDMSDDDDDDSIPYNPKNLPLGWDGKPIPYWLYKLHGLNISFPCEICGNQVYKGPKAFQRHFNFLQIQEWRHSHGMRCLGIPNTAHFANITKISDAVELWGKIRRQKESLKWNPEHDEEFEDSAGNVVNKRTFEDLKRQGLL